MLMWFWSIIVIVGVITVFLAANNTYHSIINKCKDNSDEDTK